MGDTISFLKVLTQDHEITKVIKYFSKFHIFQMPREENDWQHIVDLIDGKLVMETLDL